MRKQYKKKLRSCAMCKPHKMHGANRWKLKDLDKLKQFEKEIRNADLAQQDGTSLVKKFTPLQYGNRLQCLHSDNDSTSAWYAVSSSLILDEGSILYCLVM